MQCSVGFSLRSFKQALACFQRRINLLRIDQTFGVVQLKQSQGSHALMYSLHKAIVHDELKTALGYIAKLKNDVDQPLKIQIRPYAANGQSPLQLAAACASLPIVKALIAKRADVNYADTNKKTVLEYALSGISKVEARFTILKALFWAGASLGGRGRHILLLAIKVAHIPIIDYLKVRGVDISSAYEPEDKTLNILADEVFSRLPKVGSKERCQALLDCAVHFIIEARSCLTQKVVQDFFDKTCTNRYYFDIQRQKLIDNYRLTIKSWFEMTEGKKEAARICQVARLLSQYNRCHDAVLPLEIIYHCVNFMDESHELEPECVNRAVEAGVQKVVVGRTKKDFLSKVNQDFPFEDSSDSEGFIEVKKKRSSGP